MDIENINSWSSRPDVCRFCLSASGTLDVTASYISDVGTKEMYSEMLQDCYGINLSFLTSWGTSRVVCATCVSHLREAYSFRERVLRAEGLYTQYCRPLETCLVKTERDEETCSPVWRSGDDFAAPIGDEEIDSSELHREKVDAASIQNEKENVVKRKKQKIGKPKRKKKRVDVDVCNSNVTVEDLLVIQPKDQARPEFDSEELLENQVKDMNGGQPEAVTKTVTKNVSERKKVMLTCDTVLRDTTACPFRHHKSWFQCFFCSQDFMEINQLRDHTHQMHSDVDFELKKIKRYPRSLQIEISNLECRNCRLGLTDVIEMRRHLGEAHNKVIYNECIADYKVDASPYSCHICKQEFHVFRTLTTHLNEHYANCICDVCGKSFLNSKRLKVHKRTHEAGHFPCSECGKVLKTKTSKANHMESAHSNRQLKCQICFKPMKHYNDRIKHMSEVHDITHKFQCPICGREYNIKHYLATHIRQTHGHKNKKCPECSMAFITNHGLKKHMLKHSGEKPFSCGVCSKSYARSYTLREHMRAHEADRSFMCPD